jgi:hypothetical protein
MLVFLPISKTCTNKFYIADKVHVLSISKLSTEDQHEGSKNVETSLFFTSEVG